MAIPDEMRSYLEEVANYYGQGLPRGNAEVDPQDLSSWLYAYEGLEIEIERLRALAHELNNVLHDVYATYPATGERQRQALDVLMLDCLDVTREIDAPPSTGDAT